MADTGLGWYRRRWTGLRRSSNGMLRRALRCEYKGCEWPDGEMAFESGPDFGGLDKLEVSKMEGGTKRKS